MNAAVEKREEEEKTGGKKRAVTLKVERKKMRPMKKEGFEQLNFLID